MENLSLRFPGAMLLSYFIAILLSIIHLPLDLQAWRPEWLALVIIHWAIFFSKENTLPPQYYYRLIFR